MALTQITTDGIKDGTITGTDLTTNVDLVDNQKLRLGTGNDLQIYHDGTNSNLKNTTGTLYVAGDVVTLTNSAISELYFKGTANGAVELYYDNTLKFGTDSAGVYARGDLMLNYADNYKIKLGAGNDLQIYHDGTHSQIKDASSGELLLSGSVISLNSANSAEYMLKGTENGAVELYYDNTKRFETVSNGASVAGSFFVESGGITVSGEVGLFSGTTNQNRFIDCGLGDNNALYIRGCSGGDANHEVLAYFARNGSVGLYYDGTQKLFTHSYGAGITGDFRPSANNSYDLGSSSYRWRNIYTNDLNLSNEGSSNDVDGTWGSYTIQEGAEDLFLVNKRNGKKYKFALTEVS